MSVKMQFKIYRICVCIIIGALVCSNTFFTSAEELRELMQIYPNQDKITSVNFSVELHRVSIPLEECYFDKKKKTNNNNNHYHHHDKHKHDEEERKHKEHMDEYEYNIYSAKEDKLYKPNNKNYKDAKEKDNKIDDKENKECFFEYTGRFYTFNGNVGNVHSSKGSSSSLSSIPLLPGPIIHLAPGGKLIFALHNNLGAEKFNQDAYNYNYDKSEIEQHHRENKNKTNHVEEKSSTTTITTTSSPTSHLYSYHDPNFTNLHTHGLHADPKIDDPFITIAPGQTHVYKLPIPREHMPGLHWYHTHYHGSVYYQVMGGLFGPLVMDQGTFMTSPHYPFTHLPSHYLVFHLYRLGESSKCDGKTFEEIEKEIGTNVLASPTIVSRDGGKHELPPDLFLVNGQHRPTLRLNTGQPTFLRMLYAAGSCYVNVTLPPMCDYHVTGYDGVQLAETKQVEERYLYFTTATRVELIVVCHKEGLGAVHDVDDEDDVLFYIDVHDLAEQSVSPQVASTHANAETINHHSEQRYLEEQGRQKEKRQEEHEESKQKQRGHMTPTTTTKENKKNKKETSRNEKSQQNKQAREKGKDEHVTESTKLHSNSNNNNHNNNNSDNNNKNKKNNNNKLQFPLLLTRKVPDYLSLDMPRSFNRDISLSQLDLEGIDPTPYYVLGQGEDCHSLRSSETCHYEHFMGPAGTTRNKYHGFTVPMYSVVTIKLFGDPTEDVPHPFHFHVNHFKVISFTPRPHGQHENQTLDMYGVSLDEYRDTVPVLDGETVIQWQTASYDGEIVYHCHNLVHEDRGMMVSYYVEPNNVDKNNINERSYNNVLHAHGEGKNNKNNNIDNNNASYINEQNKGRNRYLILALMFFILCFVALAVQCIRERNRSMEAIARLRTQMAGQPSAINANEKNPLLNTSNAKNNTTPTALRSPPPPPQQHQSSIIDKVRLFTDF